MLRSFSLLHGDLVNSNILVDGENASLVDLEWSRFGHVLDDIYYVLFRQAWEYVDSLRQFSLQSAARLKWNLNHFVMFRCSSISHSAFNFIQHVRDPFFEGYYTELQTAQSQYDNGFSLTWSEEAKRFFRFQVAIAATRRAGKEACCWCHCV